MLESHFGNLEIAHLINTNIAHFQVYIQKFALMQIMSHNLSKPRDNFLLFSSQYSIFNTGWDILVYLLIINTLVTTDDQKEA